jgi:anti-anti-sigma factor
VAQISTPCPLTIEVEQSGDVATIKCHGKLVFGFCDVLYSKIRELIPTSKCIVLDLTDLQQMDSMGLGTIVRAYVSANSAGSSLVLVNIGPRIRQMLGVTNLLTVLTEMCEKGVTIRF